MNFEQTRIDEIKQIIVMYTKKGDIYIYQYENYNDKYIIMYETHNDLQLMALHKMKNGKNHGKLYDYSKNTYIFNIRNYLEGDLHGPNKVYQNNRIQSYCHYVHGKLENYITS